jgi:hypothetical protein
LVSNEERTRGTGQEGRTSGLKSLREKSVLEGHGVSRDVSSLRDSPLNLSLPGTAVPGYRLCRPCGTVLLRPVNGTAIARLLALV